MEEFKFYRRAIGGTWYFTCQYISFFGDEVFYWTNKTPHHSCVIVKTEEHFGLLGLLTLAQAFFGRKTKNI